MQREKMDVRRQKDKRILLKPPDWLERQATISRSNNNAKPARAG
jgi:hypothetical protein